MVLSTPASLPQVEPAATASIENLVGLPRSAQPQPFEPGLERAGNDQGQVFRMKKPSARLIALATLGCLVVHIRASSVLAADKSVCSHIALSKFT